MGNIPQYICGVIPPHILTRVAAAHIRLKQAAPPAPRSSTCASWPRVAPQRSSNDRAAVAATRTAPKKRRNVYDANHTLRLPGKLVMSEHKPRGTDVEVNEAYDGSGCDVRFFRKRLSAFLHRRPAACVSTPPCTTARASRTRSGTAARWSTATATAASSRASPPPSTSSPMS